MTQQQVKTQAKKLKKQLHKQGVDMPLSAALDLVANMHGERNFKDVVGNGAEESPIYIDLIKMAGQLYTPITNSQMLIVQKIRESQVSRNLFRKGVEDCLVGNGFSVLAEEFKDEAEQIEEIYQLALLASKYVAFDIQ